MAVHYPNSLHEANAFPARGAALCFPSAGADEPCFDDLLAGYYDGLLWTRALWVGESDTDRLERGTGRCLSAEPLPVRFGRAGWRLRVQPRPRQREPVDYSQPCLGRCRV